jgi:hypothetical protein
MIRKIVREVSGSGSPSGARANHALRYRRPPGFEQLTDEELVAGTIRNDESQDSRPGSLSWSGRLDSNQRPLAPHASALPDCATPRHSPTGLAAIGGVVYFRPAVLSTPRARSRTREGAWALTAQLLTPARSRVRSWMPRSTPRGSRRKAAVPQWYGIPTIGRGAGGLDRILRERGIIDDSPKRERRDRWAFQSEGAGGGSERSA